MAFRHLLASACLVLLVAAAQPASAASGDVVRQGTYVAGAPVDTQVAGTFWLVAACTDSAGAYGLFPVWGTLGACGFQDVGAGTYVVSIDDVAFDDVAFQYKGSTFFEGDCGPAGQAVGSATITLTADCPGLIVAFRQPVVAGTVTIAEA